MSEPKTHSELVAAGLRDDCDMWGIIPDNYIGVDCGMDWPGHTTRAEVEQSMRAAKAAGKKWAGFEAVWTLETEVYYVHPHIWKASGVGCWNGCLCIGCSEKRIGRRLQPFDFMAEHADGFNNLNLPGTRRRLERLLGTELVECLDEEPPELPAPSKLNLAYQAPFGKKWSAA